MRPKGKATQMNRPTPMFVLSSRSSGRVVLWLMRKSLMSKNRVSTVDGNEEVMVCVPRGRACFIMRWGQGCCDEGSEGA